MESSIGWTILLAKLCSKYLGVCDFFQLDLGKSFSTLEQENQQCLRTIKTTQRNPFGTLFPTLGALRPHQATVPLLGAGIIGQQGAVPSLRPTADTEKQK